MPEFLLSVSASEFGRGERLPGTAGAARSTETGAGVGTTEPFSVAELPCHKSTNRLPMSKRTSDQARAKRSAHARTTVGSQPREGGSLTVRTTGRGFCRTTSCLGESTDFGATSVFAFNDLRFISA